MQLCKSTCFVFLHSLLKSIALQGTFGVLPSLHCTFAFPTTVPLFLLISVGSSPLLPGLPCTRLLACGIFGRIPDFGPCWFRCCKVGFGGSQGPLQYRRGFPNSQQGPLVCPTPGVPNCHMFSFTLRCNLAQNKQQGWDVLYSLSGAVPFSSPAALPWATFRCVHSAAGKAAAPLHCTGQTKAWEMEAPPQYQVTQPLPKCATPAGESWALLAKDFDIWADNHLYSFVHFALVSEKVLWVAFVRCLQVRSYL